MLNKYNSIIHINKQIIVINLIKWSITIWLKIIKITTRWLIIYIELQINSFGPSLW